MSVLHTPFTHIPYNHYSLFRSNSVVDYASTFPHYLSKEPIPKLTFASSSSSLLPTVVDNGSHNIFISSNEQDSKEENEFVDEKETARRTRIGLANKGKVPWNKGRKHTSETRELIRIRTSEAMRDPKVKKKKAQQIHSHHSEQTKAKMSDTQRRLWKERQKSKRARELFFLLWKQNIANAAMEGGSGQEELGWDSYDKIKEQLELHRISQTEGKEKEELMAIAGSEKFFQSWMENIAKAAKEGGSGEKELDWDSYEKIKEEIVLLYQLQRKSEKARAKEIAKMKAEKEAQIKAIKKVMLARKKRDLREGTKVRKKKKSQPCKNTVHDKHALEVTLKFELGSKLTKNHVSNNISNEVAEKGDIMNSNFATQCKLDLELIIKEKMKKKVSLAEQIQAAKLIKEKLN
ncbi:unnamed protein product [Lathyrus sativus]|nr:unnamed protein product [Lathyrus sativus]